MPMFNLYLNPFHVTNTRGNLYSVTKSAFRTYSLYCIDKGILSEIFTISPISNEIYITGSTVYTRVHKNEIKWHDCHIEYA